MEHVMLRVRDVMRESFPVARYEEPLREVGRTMARDDLDIVPIVGDDGELVGVMTERALARRYVRESRKVSSLVDAPTSIRAIVEVLDARPDRGRGRGRSPGRVWVHSIDASRSDSRISDGDVVVVGNRADAQRQSLELGAALLITEQRRPARAGDPRARARARRQRRRSARSTPTSPAAWSPSPPRAARWPTASR